MRLKQEPTTIPFRNGQVTVGNKAYTIKDGTKGRYMISEFLVEDNKLSPRIANVPALMKLRELILAQTIITVNPNTGKRNIPDSTNFWGGSAYSFDMTKEGFLIVVLRDMENNNNGQMYPSDRIGGILVVSLDLLTKEGIELLKQEGLVTDEPVQVEQVKESVQDNIKLDVEKFAEVASKAANIVNSKLTGREKRVTKPV